MVYSLHGRTNVSLEISIFFEIILWHPIFVSFYEASLLLSAQDRLFSQELYHKMIIMYTYGKSQSK